VTDEEDQKKLSDCLRQKVAQRVSQYQAISECYQQVQLDIAGGVSGGDAVEGLGGLLEADENLAAAKAELQRRSAAVDAEIASILSQLQRDGATPGMIDNLRGQLTACMQGWGILAPIKQAIDYCVEDLPDFADVLAGTSTPVDAAAPVVADVGCPDDLTTGQAFTCSPRVLGTTTGFAWSLDGGGQTTAGGQSVSLTLNDSKAHTLTFFAFNTPAHVGQASQTVQAVLAAPTGGGPGCPGTANPGQAVTCTASGFAPVDEHTTYTWNATTGGSDVNIGGTFEVTFPTDQTSVTVSVKPCNLVIEAFIPQHCGPTLSQTIAKAGPAGAPEGTISCSPASGPARLEVTCTANLTNTDANTTKTWSAPGSSSQAGNGDMYIFFYETPGTTNTVTLTACNGNACSTPSAAVRVDAGAPNLGMSCTPVSGQAPLSVSCAASGAGFSVFDIAWTWTTTGARNSPGNSDTFAATFDSAGNHSVTLKACLGSACSNYSAAVTVTAPPAAPTGSISCSPATLFTGDRTTCSAQLIGTTTATNWSAPNGSPGAGAGATFSTSYDSTGGQSITLQACNGTSCVSLPTSVNVLRKPDPTAAVARPAPIALSGSINVTEQDIGCGFSAMPATAGTINMTLSFGTSPGDPIVASGSMRGGGSGSRGVACAGGTASQSWSASYSGTFSGGVVDQASGAVSITGSMLITQSASYSDCKDTSGKSAPCPGAPVSRSYPMTLTGTVNVAPGGTAAAGSGGVVIDTGCATAGSWRFGG
jgi:hypothetical protein